MLKNDRINKIFRDYIILTLIGGFVFVCVGCLVLITGKIIDIVFNLGDDSYIIGLLLYFLLPLLGVLVMRFLDDINLFEDNI